MKKLNIPTIIFGAAISVAGAYLTAPTAFAANADVSSKINSTAKIDSTGVFSIGGSGKAEGIEATDYVEYQFDNLALSSTINGRDVVHNGVTIGKFSYVYNGWGSKTIDKPVDESVDPFYSNGTIRLTFNENISKVDDFSFSLSSQNNVDWMKVDHDYTLTNKITSAGKTLAEIQSDYGKTSVKNITRPCLANGGVYYYIDGARKTQWNVHFENDGANPTKAGAKYRVTIPAGSTIKFKEHAGGEYTANHHWSHVYADTPKNANGVYFTGTTPKPKFKVTIKGNVAEYELLEDLPARDGTWYFAIEDLFEIDHYEDVDLATNTMPYAATFETIINGQTVCTREGGNVTFNGAGVEAFLTERIERTIDRPETVPQTIKVGETPDPKAHIENFDELYPGCSVRYKDAIDNTKPGEFEVSLIISCPDKDDLEVTAILIIEEDDTVEEAPEIKEEPKKEAPKIEAPHTGLEISGGAAIIASITALLSLTGLALKRR